MRKRRPTHWIVFLSIALLGSFLLSSAHALQPESDYLDAVRLYKAGHYEKAAMLFEKLAKDGGIVNGKLYYNAGNSWFKAGNVGRAMLWYERARKLIPDDPDLLFNYRYVSGFLKDKVEQEGSPLFDVLFFWKDLLGRRAIQLLSLGLFALFWVLVIVSMARSGRISAVHYSVLLIALVFTLTALYDYYDANFNRRAVIIADSAPVRSGLTESATELFALHAGTRVGVEEQRDGYLKIRFSKEKIGWIKRDYLEII